VFFVDVDGHERDAGVASALAEVRAACESVKVLGSYPKADSVVPPVPSASST
jgi:prephenate dehydratase